MKKNLYLLAFFFGLACALSVAAALKLLGMPLGTWDAISAQARAQAASLPDSGAAYTIDWSSIDSGGGLIAGGNYQMTSIIGQPDVGSSTGGSYVLIGGFLPGIFQNWQRYLPLIRR